MNYARLIERSFQRVSDAVGYAGRDFASYVADEVRDNSNDRRFTLKFNAATVPMRSAIVTYHGSRYHVEHDYRSNTWTARRTGSAR